MNLSYNLFLDDIRDPLQCVSYMKNPIYENLEWVIVRSYDEFVEMISKNGLPEVISFDHDLSTDDAIASSFGEPLTEKTGFDCARWLTEYLLDTNLTCPYFLVHSMNPTGKVNIESLLYNFNRFIM